MELSTSLNIAFPVKNGGPDLDYTVERQLDDMKEIGFSCFDFNFVDYTLAQGSPLLGREWESWVRGIRERAEANGQRFYQSHGHMFDVLRLYDEETNALLIDRAIRGSGMLGVKWVVYHPYNMGMNRVEARKKSYERFVSLREKAEKVGVGIAIENMPFPETYGGQVEELLEFAEKLDLGICWDTSHANLTGYQDQAVPLRMIGKRLKTLHVSDNFGQRDDHLAPGYGSVNWESVMTGLREIGYEGTFNFEAHQFARSVPETSRLTACRLLYQIGVTLLGE